MASPPAEVATDGAAQGWQLGTVLRRVRLAAIAVAAGMVLLVALEAARLLQLAAGLHPLAGAAAGAALVAGLGWLCLPLWRALRLPRVVCPPAVPADDSFEPRHLASQSRYLARYLSACVENPALAEQRSEVEAVRRELAGLRPRWEGSEPADAAALRAEMKQWVERRVTPLLAPLDERADRLIYQEALSVGLGTAISPNGTLDSFVVLWRSVQMSSRLATLYYGRPGPMGTLRVLAEVALATVAATYAQRVGDSLGGLVARSMGGIAGVVAGPATQGVTNALVMVRLGYLVQSRCRSFRRWDPRAQRSALAAALAATQRVALGLVSEILRQAGSGLGVVAGAAARGVSQAAGGLASAAEAAFSLARDVGQRISNGLKSLGEPDRAGPAGEGGHGAAR